MPRIYEDFVYETNFVEKISLKITTLKKFDIFFNGDRNINSNKHFANTTSDIFPVQMKVANLCLSVG